MKFVVVDKCVTHLVEAEDIFDAIEQMWDNHTGYKHILSVSYVPDKNYVWNDER